MPVIDMVMDRHDLDGSDIQVGQVLDGCFRCQARVSALQFSGTSGIRLVNPLGCNS